MKKRLFTIMIMLLLFHVAFSQAFEEKSKAISLDIGLGRLIGWGTGGIPPISASFDMGIKQLGPGILSVGGLIGVATSKFSAYDFFNLSNYGYSYTYIPICARAIYHWFPIRVNKLDTYGGIILGCDIVSSKFTSAQYGINPPVAGKTGVIFGAFIGARYFFTDNFGVNAELGYSLAIF